MDPDKFVTINIKDQFTRLKDVCYLDHIGAALYTDSQIDAIAEDLKTNLYGNPHSLNTNSKLAHDTVDQLRYRILDFFNTDSEEYSVVFTSGATEALKLVTEWFEWNCCARTRFQDGCECDINYNGVSGQFAYMQDNHTSVLGLREIATSRGINVRCLSHDEAFEIFERDYCKSVRRKPEKYSGNSLFVYSAQCNFSGIKYPLTWIKKVHDGILDDTDNVDNSDLETTSRWFCLLDAASFVSTNKLDLTVYKPDFVAISFYKIFGYPTGLGAILVKNSSACLLNKLYYGGGTVLISLSDTTFHVKRPVFHEKCEDGTINYLSVISLKQGFDTLQQIGGSMIDISQRVFGITKYLHDNLLKLHHCNGQFAIKLYCDTDYSDSRQQGNIVNFNVLRNSGEYVGYFEVLNIANLYNICLRTGCFCNPGACQRHLQLTNDQLKENYLAGHTCANNIDLLNGYPTGSVRVSFGYMSNCEDADKLIKMLIDCFISKPVINKVPEYWPEEQKKLKEKFGNLESSHNSLDDDSIHPNKNKNDYNCPNLTRFEINLRLPSEGCLNVKLSRIFVYPIKSCGYHKVTSDWYLTKTGLKYDREWMIVTDSGVALTQKQEPTMCKIKPFINIEENIMVLSYSGNLETVAVPLNNYNDLCSSKESTKSLSLCQSKVCNDRIEGIDCGNKVAEWISTTLNISGLRLIKLCSRNKTSIRKNNTDMPLSFANQAQLLLINEASVAWLIDLLDQSNVSVDLSLESMIDRFRGNFVICGSVPSFSEQSWTHVSIGCTCFEIDGPCHRCQMICINQGTGKKDKEPLTVLAAALKGRMRFGIYLRICPVETDRSIKVGDIVIPNIDSC